MARRRIVLEAHRPAVADAMARFSRAVESEQMGRGTENGTSRRWQVVGQALTILFALALVMQSLVPAVVVAERKRDRDGDGSGARAQAERVEKATMAVAEWRRRGVDAEVVGGKPVKHGAYKYTTLLLLDVGDGTYQCGGTLIDANFVLTAAHCVEDDAGRIAAPAAFSLIIGKAKISKIGAQYVRGVKRVARHPGWNPRTYANDVAVLELSQPVPSSVAVPVTMVHSGETAYNSARQLAAVVGWGATSETGPESEALRAADVRIVSDSTCFTAYGSEFVQSSMICAAAKKRDSCYGDSGGPLMAKEVIGYKIKKEKKDKHKHNKHHKNNKKDKKRTKRMPQYRMVQMGIVSWGAGCAVPNFPGVYTRLSAPGINDFIVDAMNG